MNYAYSDSTLLLPFRHLLKPGTKFAWTDELRELFELSKTKIVEAVISGVKTFDTSRTTCLCTDWSRSGMGFALMQKVCGCLNVTPLCCKSGWSLCYSGSRFLTPAESRYHPVEGEAGAAAWALYKTRHFTLGCKRLLLAVDHKPLVKILGDRALGEIDNPRILNFKEKCLRWTFEVIHIPGSLHKAADAISRSPVESATAGVLSMSTEDCSNLFLDMEQVEAEVLGAGRAAVASLARFTGELHTRSGVRVLRWQELEDESSRDDTVRALHKFVTDGTPEDRVDWPGFLRPYYARQEEICCIGDVVTLKNRVVVPSSLRGRVLDILHSGHSGATGMMDRARSVVFWPEMSQDILGRRA